MQRAPGGLWHSRQTGPIDWLIKNLTSQAKPKANSVSETEIRQVHAEFNETSSRCVSLSSKDVFAYWIPETHPTRFGPWQGRAREGPRI